MASGSQLMLRAEAVQSNRTYSGLTSVSKFRDTIFSGFAEVVQSHDGVALEHLFVDVALDCRHRAKHLQSSV